MSKAVDTPTGRPEPGLTYAQFVKRVLTVLAICTVSAAIWLVAWFSVNVWLLGFAGILLAIFLRGLADWVSGRTRLRPAWSLAVVLMAFVALGALATWLLAPDAIQQFNELAERLPNAVERFKQHLQQFGLFRYLVEKLPSASDLGPEGSKVLSKLGGFFSNSAEAVTGLVLTLFLGLYLAAAPEVYVRGFTRLFPLSKRVHVREILKDLGATLRNWLLGQLLSMLVVGVLIGVGLKLLGIPLPVALGLLAGLFDFIPIIGPLISAIPAVLLAFLISPWHALYAALLYLLVNTVIESHLLVPLIQRYTVSLPPALTVLALVLMGTLFGFLGVLLATPLAATVLVLVKLAYVRDVLGDTE